MLYNLVEEKITSNLKNDFEVTLWPKYAFKNSSSFLKKIQFKHIFGGTDEDTHIKRDIEEALK